MPLATFNQSDRLGEIVIDSPPLNLFSGELLADLRAAVDQAAAADIRALLLRAEGEDLAAGPTRAHATTKRVLQAWRSGGVAAADRVTHAEGPAVMLSRDLQEGIASLVRDGP